MTLVVEVTVEVLRLLGQMKDFLLAGGGHGEIERVILILRSVRISRFAGAAAAKQFSSQQVSYYGDSVGLGHDIDTALTTRFTQDTGIKASGAGSLRFTIPSNSPPDTSGF
jgi:hypothetical protein